MNQLNLNKLMKHLLLALILTMLLFECFSMSSVETSAVIINALDLHKEVSFKILTNIKLV